MRYRSGTNYVFKSSDEEIKDPNLPYAACFSDMKSHYKTDKFFYQNIHTYPRFMRGLEKEIGEQFKNISIKILSAKSMCYKRDNWGDMVAIEEGEEDPKNPARYLIKVIISEKYSSRAKYMVTTLMGVLLRMVCMSENYIDEKFNPEKVDFDYIVEINNLNSNNTHSGHNSNHVFFCPGDMKREMILWMDNVELMNEVFSVVHEDGGDMRGSLYGRKGDFFTLDLGHWVSQTAILNVIGDFLEENPDFLKKEIPVEKVEEKKVTKKRVARKKKVE